MNHTNDTKRWHKKGSYHKKRGAEFISNRKKEEASFPTMEETNMSEKPVILKVS